MPVSLAAARAAHYAFFLATLCAIMTATGAVAWELRGQAGIAPVGLAALGLMGTVAWICRGLAFLRPRPWPALRPELSERYRG